MSALGQVIYLPDILEHFPWKRTLNQHHYTAKAESVAWLESFKPFSPKAQIAFNKCDFSLLCSLTSPRSEYHLLRSFDDLMHLFFVIDEYTDTLDAQGVKSLCDISMDAIKNVYRPRAVGENLLGEMTRQFWERACRYASPTAQRRFIVGWRSYLDSVVRQASHREKTYICTIEEYIIARRANIGIEPVYAFMEILLGIELPDEVLQHPAIVSLNDDTADMLLLTNDLYSYKKEVLYEDGGYNMVTIVMANKKTDVAGAIRYICELFKHVMERFLRTQADVLNHRNGFPSWGKKIDREIAEYIDCLGHWVRGHDEWSFSSGRYFGDEGLKVQQTRTVRIA